VRHGDAGRDVLFEEQLLDRNDVRREGADQLLRVVVDLVEAARKTRMRGGFDDAGAHEPEFVLFAVNDAETDRCDSGVDAHDPHSTLRAQNFILLYHRTPLYSILFSQTGIFV